MFAGEKKTDITLHKLGNMSLSSEVLTFLPSATSFELALNSKVREEYSFVFLKYRNFCQFGTQQSYWLTPSTTIFLT